MSKAEKVAAIEEYYTKHFDRLCKMRTRWVGGIHNAEDAVQEGVCRALKYVNSWNGEEVEPWLNSIISNACRDFKKKDRLQGGVKEPLYELEEGRTPDLSITHFNSDMVEKVLSSMEERRGPVREVLKAYLVEGYSTTEIAEYIDMAPEAMRKAAQRFKEDMVVRYGENVCC